jgi:hypothetical protein
MESKGGYSLEPPNDDHAPRKRRQVEGNMLPSHHGILPEVPLRRPQMALSLSTCSAVKEHLLFCTGVRCKLCCVVLSCVMLY